MAKTKLQTKVEKIFGEVGAYYENPSSDTVSFELDYSMIDFEKLEKLSKLLETRSINFPNVNTIDGYSGSVYHTVSVEASKVKFRPLERT